MGEIRIVGPGNTRGYPYPVCKKIFFSSLCLTNMCGSGMNHINACQISASETKCHFYQFVLKADSDIRHFSLT